MFYDWCVKKYSGENSPSGDFAADMVRDKTFPRGECDREQILNHLYFSCRACPEAIAVFKRLWKAYLKASEK